MGGAPDIPEPPPPIIDSPDVIDPEEVARRRARAINSMFSRDMMVIDPGVAQRPRARSSSQVAINNASGGTGLRIG